MARHDYRWLIEPWHSPLLYISLLLFVLVKITAWLNIHVFFVHSHLNDLISIPVFVATAISLERLIGGDHELRYGKARITFFVIFVGVIYEFYLPYRSVRYTADYYDLLCYAAGGIMTWFFSPCIKQNK